MVRRSPSLSWIAALRRALDRLAPAGTALPMAELIRLGTTGVPMEIDFEAARRIGLPVIVLREAPGAVGPMTILTLREREVAALAARGLRNRAIARALVISESTVKDHIHHILTKLGLGSRTELAALSAHG